MLFLGIVAAGGIYAGTNPAYTRFELAHHFKTSQAKFLIVAPELLQGPILSAARDCQIPQFRQWVFNHGDENVPVGFASWASLLEHGERDWVRFDDEETSRTTTAARLYSSGTTGLPKAAAISHYNLVSQETIVNEDAPVPYEIRRLIYLPMFHAAMVPSAHIAPLRSGVASFVLKRFDLEQFLWTIHNHKITDLIFVPPVAVATIKSPLTKKYSLFSIKAALCGAGSLDKDNQSVLQKLLAPESTFTQGWAMTETACSGSKFNYPEDDHTGSIGRMLPNLDVKSA